MGYSLAQNRKKNKNKKVIKVIKFYF